MKWSVTKLSILAGALSIVVLFESMFILTVLLERDRQYDVKPEIPKEVLNRINKESMEEAAEFAEVFEADGESAVLSLEQEACDGCEYQSVGIFLNASVPVKSVQVKMQVPEALEFADYVADVDGIQMTFGEADTYLKNEIRSGQARLDVVFEEGFAGKMKLAELVYKTPLASEQVSFSFDYQENLLTESYVTDFVTGKNILRKPLEYSF